MNHLPSEREYLKQNLEGFRFKGTALVLAGCLGLLIFSVSEFATFADGMDGMLQAYFNLVRSGSITLREAVKNLIETPAAMQDLWKLIYLFCLSFLSVIPVLLSGRRSTLYFCVCLLPLVLFASPEGTVLTPLLTFPYLIKVVSAAAIAAGCVLMYLDVRIKKKLIRHKYEKLLKKRHDRTDAVRHGRKNTMIPERIKQCK